MSETIHYSMSGKGQAVCGAELPGVDLNRCNLERVTCQACRDKLSAGPAQFGELSNRAAALDKADRELTEAQKEADTAMRAARRHQDDPDKVAAVTTRLATALAAERAAWDKKVELMKTA